jgi:hypothetical protein
MPGSAIPPEWHTVYLPSSAGDIDLFLVVGGGHDEVREHVCSPSPTSSTSTMPTHGACLRPVECATRLEPAGSNCDACVRKKNSRLDAARKISPCVTSPEARHRYSLAWV